MPMFSWILCIIGRTGIKSHAYLDTNLWKLLQQKDYRCSLAEFIVENINKYRHSQ